MVAPLVLSSLVALSSTPPVRLATCEVSTLANVQSDNGPATVGGYTLHVRFFNTASQPISRVTFTLNDGSRVTDVGTFSPGITIDHMLRLASSDATTCTATAVRFADGAIWNAN